jgi:hypothetical protein
VTKQAAASAKVVHVQERQAAMIRIAITAAAFERTLRS